MSEDLTLLGLLQREVGSLSAEPAALATTLFTRLALQAWDQERITAALEFGDAPALRFRKGLPPPARMSAPVSRHRSRVVGAGFASDRRLCSWSEDGQVICWNPGSGEMAWWLGTHPALTAAAIAGHQTILVTGSRQGEVAAWNLESSARMLWEAPATGAEVTVVLPDRGGDRVFVGYGDGCVCMFDLPTGRLSELLGAGSPVHHLAQTSSGTLMAGSDDGVVTWFNVSSHEVQYKAQAHSGRIVSLRASGERLTSASEDGLIKWWTVGGDLGGSHEGVRGLQGAVWVDHHALVMWAGNTVTLVVNGKFEPLTVHPYHVTDVQVVPAKQRGRRSIKPLVVSCSADGTVELNRVKFGAPMKTYRHDAPAAGCLVGPLDEIVSWDDDGHIVVSPPGVDRPLRRLGEPDDAPTVRLHHSVSETSLIVSGARDLICYHLDSPALVKKEVLASRRSKWPRRMSVDEHLGYRDERPAGEKMRQRHELQRLPWKVMSSKRVRALAAFLRQLELKSFEGVSIGVDRAFHWVAVAWSAEGDISICPEGRSRFTGVTHHQGRIEDIVWIDRDLLAAITWHGEILLLNPSRGTVEATLTGHEGRVRGCVAHYGDEWTLISWGDDCTIRRWRPRGLLATLELADRPSAVALLRDDRTVVGTQHGSIVVADPYFRSHSNPVHAHARRVSGLAPIPIGRDAIGVVSCGEDARLKVWRIGADHGLVQDDVALGEAPFVQIVPLGQRTSTVAVLDEAGAVWVYDTGPPPWASEASKRREVREPAARARSR